MVRSRPFAVYLALLYVVTVWALNTVAVKYAVADVDPLAFTGLRFLAMTPLAFLLAKATGNSIAISRRDLPLLIGCGACGYGVYQYFWVIGLANTSAFASALLSSLTPVVTLMILASLSLERVQGGRWSGAAIALFGVAVFEGAFAGRATFRIGDALTLGSAACFALFNVFSARLLNRYTPLALVAISMFFGTLMILPGAIPRIAHQDFTHLPLAVWLVFAYAVLFPIVLTYPVWSWAISRLGAGRTSLFQFAVPVFAGFFSVAFLHSRIEPHQIIGAAVCIGGMAISQIAGTRSG